MPQVSPVPFTVGKECGKGGGKGEGIDWEWEPRGRGNV